MLRTALLSQPFAEFVRDTAGTGSASPDSPRDDGWRRAVDRLLEFWNWTEDWDGEGAAAPDRAAIRGAIALVQQWRDSVASARAAGEPHFLYRPPDRLLPGRAGEIILEWRSSTHEYAEIEVASATEANGMLVFADGRPTIFDTIALHSSTC